MLQKSFVRLVLKTAHEMGWSVTAVYDGEDTTDATGKSFGEIVKLANATDESVIRFRNETTGIVGSVYIVWQGPVSSYPYGEEAVNDYSLSLDPVMDAAYMIAS